MARLPALDNWDSTRDALHQIALVISAIRVACAEKQPNDLQYSLDVTASGLTTSRLNIGGELQFDITNLQLIYARDGRKAFILDVAGTSQKSLMSAVVGGFAALGIDISPAQTHITHEKRFEIERGLAANYVTLLDAVYTALSRFRARLSGCMSPLVLWAHHFDLAFIWFAGTSTDEHNDPQLAFGFAPCSPGLDRPYFYAYGWSPTAGYLEIPVSPPARAITEGYTGLYAGYDDLRTQDRFESEVERVLLDYHQLAKAKL